MERGCAECYSHSGVSKAVDVLCLKTTQPSSNSTSTHKRAAKNKQSRPPSASASARTRRSRQYQWPVRARRTKALCLVGAHFGNWRPTENKMRALCWCALRRCQCPPRHTGLSSTRQLNWISTSPSRLRGGSRFLDVPSDHLLT